MSRYFGALVCVGLAAYVAYGQHMAEGPVLVFVGLDRLVGSDPDAQATWTWRLLLLLGALMGAVSWWRRPQWPQEDQESA